MNHEFIKMNGAGNDFVVFDARKQPLSLNSKQVIDISARTNHITKGCDQLIIIEPSSSANSFMRIYNADGGEVDACGNATRCIAFLLEKELGKLPLSIATNAGVLQGVRKEKLDTGDEYILVDMGKPKFGSQDIPLAMSVADAAKKVSELAGLPEPVFVSMGNPHVVFFVEELPENGFVIRIGSKLENYKEVFPKGVNVSFAVLYDNHNIYSKVWERGAGMTKACGTAACAMLAAANKLDREVAETVVWFENSTPPQLVHVAIAESGNILLGGAVEIEFKGVIEL